MMAQLFKWIISLGFIYFVLSVVKGTNELDVDVCAGEDLVMSCPSRQRIIFKSSVVKEDVLGCENSGLCFSSEIKEILLRSCSSKQSCHLNNSQLISEDSTLCGQTTVLAVSYYCEDEFKFINLCHHGEETDVGNDVIIGVNYNKNNKNFSSSAENKSVAECTVKIRHQTQTGFLIDILDADFPNEAEAKLCQESLYIGLKSKLEAMLKNSSHLFCDEVKTGIRVRTGISRFQVVQQGHINWRLNRGLLIHISGEEMGIAQNVKFSNKSYTIPSQTKQPDSSPPNILNEIDNLLNDIKKGQKRNISSKDSSGLVTSIAVLVTVAMLFFVVVLCVIICYKRRSGVAKLTVDEGNISQRPPYVIGSLLDLRKYRLLIDGEAEENFSPMTTMTVCSDEDISDLEMFRRDLDNVSELHTAGGFQPVLEAISEENLEDLDDVMAMGHLELDKSTIALYGSPYDNVSSNWKIQSPLTTSKFSQSLDKTHAVSIEMRNLDHDGHYTMSPALCGTKLDEALSTDGNKSSFFKRLGLLKKHQTFDDIRAMLVEGNKNDSVFSANESEVGTTVSKCQGVTTESNGVNLTVCVDVERQWCTFAKDEAEAVTNDLDKRTMKDSDVEEHLGETLTIIDNEESVCPRSRNELSDKNAFGSIGSLTREAVSVSHTFVVNEKPDVVGDELHTTSSDKEVYLEEITEVDQWPAEDDKQTKENQNQGTTLSDNGDSSRKSVSDGESSFDDATGTKVESIEGTTVDPASSDRNAKKEQEENDPNEKLDANNNLLEDKAFGKPLASSSKEDLLSLSKEDLLSLGSEENSIDFPLSSSDFTVEGGHDITTDHLDSAIDILPRDHNRSTFTCVSPSLKRPELDKFACNAEDENLRSAGYTSSTPNYTKGSFSTSSYQKATDASKGDTESQMDGSCRSICEFGENDPKTHGSFREHFNLQQLSISQKCYYNSFVEQREDDTNTEQPNRDKSLVDEESLNCNFDNEIELRIHGDIDLNESQKVRNFEEEFQRQLEEKIEAGEISASNNSSFINISWSQTDSATKEKLAKENCLTQ